MPDLPVTSVAGSKSVSRLIVTPSLARNHTVVCPSTFKGDGPAGMGQVSNIALVLHVKMTANLG